MNQLRTIRSQKFTMFQEVCLFILRQKFNDYLTRHLLQEVTLGKDLIVKMHKNRVVGYCVYFKKFLFFPAITWVTDRKYRRRGIASELFDKITENKKLLCIRTVNNASFCFAKSKGFITVFKGLNGTYMARLK